MLKKLLRKVIKYYLLIHWIAIGEIRTELILFGKGKPYQKWVVVYEIK